MSFFVSQPYSTPPAQFLTETQRHIYDTLLQLEIPFQRVDTDDGTTMDDCVYISEGLNCPVVKTIFVCNRQQTMFYLYVTAAEKPFVTRDFCGALGISRVSFAPAELLWEKLGTRVGATTVLSLINDPEHHIQLVMDQDIVDREEYACTDGTNTGFMKFPMSDLLKKYLPLTGHEVKIIKN